MDDRFEIIDNRKFNKLKRDLAIIVTDKGIINDGTISIVGKMNILLTEIGSDETDLYFSKGNYLIDSDITIPSNINLIMANGAKFVGDAGTETLTINGGLDAGYWQIFDNLVVEGSPIVYEVRPEWFGAKQVAGFDNKTAFDYALGLCASVGLRLRCLAGTYEFSTELAVIDNPSSGFGIIGDGRGSTTFRIKANDFTFLWIKTSSNVSLEEFSVLGLGQTNTIGIRIGDFANLKRTSYLHVKNVRLQSCTTGLKHEYGWINSFYGVACTFCDLGADFSYGNNIGLYSFNCENGVEACKISQGDYLLDNCVMENCTSKGLVITGGNVVLNNFYSEYSVDDVPHLEVGTDTGYVESIAIIGGSWNFSRNPIIFDKVKTVTIIGNLATLSRYGNTVQVTENVRQFNLPLYPNSDIHSDLLQDNSIQSPEKPYQDKPIFSADIVGSTVVGNIANVNYEDTADIIVRPSILAGGTLSKENDKIKLVANAGQTFFGWDIRFQDVNIFDLNKKHVLVINQKQSTLFNGANEVNVKIRLYYRDGVSALQETTLLDITPTWYNTENEDVYMLIPIEFVLPGDYVSFEYLRINNFISGGNATVGGETMYINSFDLYDVQYPNLPYLNKEAMQNFYSIKSRNITLEDKENSIKETLKIQDGSVKVSSSAWNESHVVMGTYHLWVDSTGSLRINNGKPSSDTDGSVVGTQT